MEDPKLLINRLDTHLRVIGAVKARIESCMNVLEREVDEASKCEAKLRALKALPSQQEADFNRVMDMLTRGVPEPAAKNSTPVAEPDGNGNGDGEGLPLNTPLVGAGIEDAEDDHDRLMSRIHRAHQEQRAAAAAAAEERKS